MTPGRLGSAGKRHRIDRRRQVVVRRESILGPLRHHLQEDRAQLGGKVRTKVANVGRRVLGMPRELVGDVAAGKGSNPGQQVVEGAAQRIHVALDAGRAAVSRLLGRHVVDRADRRPLPRDSLILELVLERQAQVDDLDLARPASAGCSMA